MDRPFASIQPRKRFGQHFLRDPLIPEKLVHWIAPDPADHFVEIGPGTGALSRCLLRKNPASLTLIEIDRDLVAALRQVYFRPSYAEEDGATGVRGALFLIEGDALRVDYAALAAERGAPLRVVGNLPYNIASPLLLHLANFRAALRDQLFMLQKEVVDRIVALPGSAAFGRLSVMLQSCYACEWLFDVEPEAFDPPPRVRSAVIRLRRLPRDAAQRQDPVRFRASLEALARVGFAHRRKMLRGTLLPWLAAQGFDPLTAVELGFRPEARPQDIAVDQWCALAAILERSSPNQPLRSISSTL